MPVLSNAAKNNMVTEIITVVSPKIMPFLFSFCNSLSGICLAIIFSSTFLLNILFSIFLFFLPFIITQSAFFKAERSSRNGPEGIVNPLPIHCFSLKQIIDKFFLIEKS